MSAPTFIITRPVYQGAFDNDDPKYKCCCGCVHVITGAIIIGVLEIFGCVTNLIGAMVRKEPETSPVHGFYTSSIVNAVIAMLVVALLFVGIAKRQHQWVLPHLIVQVIGIIILIIGAIAVIVIGAAAATVVTKAVKDIDSMEDKTVTDIVMEKEMEKDVFEFTATFIAIVVIILIVAAIFEIWFFVVILKLYRFLRDHNVTSPEFVQYAQPQILIQPQPIMQGPQQMYQPPPQYEYPNPMPAGEQRGFEYTKMA